MVTREKKNFCGVGGVLSFQIMATWWGWLGWQVWRSVERDPTLMGPVPALLGAGCSCPCPWPCLCPFSCSCSGPYSGRLQWQSWCFWRKATGYNSWYWQGGNGPELAAVCYTLLGPVNLLHPAKSSMFHPAGSRLLHPAGSSLLHPAGSSLLHPAGSS